MRDFTAGFLGGGVEAGDDLIVAGHEGAEDGVCIIPLQRLELGFVAA